jgi:hypothetical protein
MEYQQASYALARQARLNKQESDRRESRLTPSRDAETEFRSGRDSQQLDEGSSK